jgi:hypothetical protein
MKIYSIALFVFLSFFMKESQYSPAPCKTVFPGLYQQMFEIVAIYNAKSPKKPITAKDKRLSIKISSGYDMGNTQLVIFLNGQKIKYSIKETGTESVGGKVKVVTSVNYEILTDCPNLLKPGDNELIINGFGEQQLKIFKVQ